MNKFFPSEHFELRADLYVRLARRGFTNIFITWNDEYLAKIDSITDELKKNDAKDEAIDKFIKMMNDVESGAIATKPLPSFNDATDKIPQHVQDIIDNVRLDPIDVPAEAVPVYRNKIIAPFPGMGRPWSEAENLRLAEFIAKYPPKQIPNAIEISICPLNLRPVSLEQVVDEHNKLVEDYNAGKIRDITKEKL